MTPPEPTSTPSPAAVRRKVRRRRLAALALVLIAGAAVVWWRMPDKPARLPGLRYWTSPSTGMDFVYIAPGTFMMGSPEWEEIRFDNETQHEVTITKGFWLGVTEVTQGQWKALMGSNPSAFKGRNHPVEMVSWDDCQAFIAKLCDKEGVPLGTYRLPTEAQWEFACRAGTTGPFAGNLDELAWYKRNSQSRRIDLVGAWKSDWSKGIPPFYVYSPRTALVGQKEANALGLYDMHGNVSEWCEDGYEEYGKQLRTDTCVSSSNSGRIIRGGSFHSSASLCRSALRSKAGPGLQACVTGFRLLRLDSSFPTPR